MNKKNYIYMQLLNIIFSLASVMIKICSQYLQDYRNKYINIFVCLTVYMILMVVYAIGWQKVIKEVSLSTAYLSKGLILFWSLIWSCMIFSEKITINNILGTIIIFCGTCLVNNDD